MRQSAKQLSVSGCERAEGPTASKLESDGFGRQWMRKSGEAWVVEARRELE